LTISDREFIVLLGPSGCGKTTLLRCLAGLEQVDGGRVFFGDREVTNLPVRQRRISMVFQSYAVFPHMKVFENIAFGLRMQRKSDSEVKKRVNSSAELLHIEDLLDRFPAQLSGGQRQRVAVARAIAYDADVLLMDEPLSNLDALLRLEMRAELKRLLNELKTTVVYVTHDQVEALSLGDRIAVMRKGLFLQLDTPLKVYDTPADHFVGSFIGSPPMNFLSGHLAGDGDALLVENSRLPIKPGLADRLRKNGQPEVWLGIRSENIDPGEDAHPGALPGRVIVVEPLGSHILLTVRVGESIIKVNAHADFIFEPEQPISLNFSADKIRLFDKQSGKAF
jgi:multiple sugar transport system ATP-binding protein